MSETDAEIAGSLVELLDDLKQYDPDLSKMVEDIISEVEILGNKLDRRKAIWKKYIQSEKGKKVSAKACKKYYHKTYIPNGRPVGRPRIRPINVEKKPRGRPRIHPIKEVVEKKPRGRPRKQPKEEEEN